MQDSDQQHFGETLRAMCGAYRVKYGPDIFRGYWMVLKDMPLADFDTAVQATMKTATKGMPYPAEIWATSRKGWV
jgi:hypothetical protein